MSKVVSRAPLYIQLRERLRAKIRRGEYAPGTAIPSESRLAETYGLHRLSVRNAVDSLADEGLLKSIRGKGVFVCGPKERKKIAASHGYRHSLKAEGAAAQTRILMKAVREAGPLYARWLQLDSDERVWFIRRIISIDGPALALEDIVLPYQRVPNLAETDLQLFPLLSVLEWNHISPQEGEQVLRITRLEPALAKLIGISPDQPVQEFSFLLRDEEGKPFEYSRCFIRSERTEFIVHYAGSQPDSTQHMEAKADGSSVSIGS